MTYEPWAVWREIEGAVRTDPTITLTQLSTTLQIGRNVIESTCRQRGTTFMELRQAAIFEAATRVLASPGVNAIKAAAIELGYTPRAFSRLIQRRAGLTPTALRASLLSREAKLRRSSFRAPRSTNRP